MAESATEKCFPGCGDEIENDILENNVSNIERQPTTLFFVFHVSLNHKSIILGDLIGSCKVLTWKP